MVQIDVRAQPYTYEISTAEVDITLDPTRLYIAYHTGLDSSGSASTVSVFLQCDGGSAVASNANAEGKIVLGSGVGLPLPPAVSAVKAITASSQVTIIILPGFKGPQELIQ